MKQAPKPAESKRRGNLMMAALLILGLTALDFWYPGTVPVFRELTVQWKIISLNHGDSRAAFTLGEMGPKATRAVPALIKALDSDAEGVRGTAAGALGKIGPAAVPALIKALDSSRHEVRDAAAGSLGDIVRTVRDERRQSSNAQKSTEPLINALQDDDMRVRSAAAMALQSVLPAVKDPNLRAKALKPLIRAMSDSDSQVRGYAPVALGKIGTEDAKNALRNVGIDPESFPFR